MDSRLALSDAGPLPKGLKPPRLPLTLWNCVTSGISRRLPKILNFTKAAARLHLAQPSLTRQIHKLEAELGVLLLNRSKNQVTLTEEGRSFLVDVQRLLALATESVLAVQRLSRGETGQLNIAYLSNFDFEMLPETLRAFRHTFPHVALNLFDMTPAEQLRALEARKIDLGFLGLPPPASAPGLQWESIARHRTVAVLPAKHPLAARRQVKLGELETMFFVGLSEKTHPGFRDWLNRTCRQAGFTPRVLQDAELEPALMTFVAEGLGVTLAREHIKRIAPPRGRSSAPWPPRLRVTTVWPGAGATAPESCNSISRIVKNLAAHPHGS